VDEQLLRDLAAAPEPRSGGITRRVFVTPGEENVTELLIIRHGQMPPASVDSSEDPPLTDVGREQARVLGEFLARDRKLDAVLCSPTLRARQTAAGIALPQGLTPEVDDRLREVEIYAPEGVNLREAIGPDGYERMGDEFARSRRWDAFAPWREPSDQIRRRMVNIAEDVIRRYPGGRVAMVTHTTLVNTYISEVVASPYDLIFPVGLASVSIVLARGDLRSVRTLNSLSHFYSF
jgi:broad specificity phosphatase PhoE